MPRLSTITARLLLPAAFFVMLSCAGPPLQADSLDQFQVAFDDNADDESAFVEVGTQNVAPAITPLQPLAGGRYVNSGISNAAYVAVVPNAGGGTQYATPVNGIVLPQAYWNNATNTTGNQGDMVLVAVPVNANSNGVRSAGWNGNTYGANPIRLASTTLTDDLSGDSGMLTTGVDTQFGSIPSGTPVVLLAQNPEWGPVNSLSPTTAPGAAGPTFTGPYSSPNSGYSTVTGPSSAGSTYDPNFRSALSERYDQMIRFMNSLTVHALWMPNSGGNPLGNTELRAQTRFAIPCQMMGNTMFYIAPAFQANFWSSSLKSPDYNYSFSKTTFGAWLDAGIEPQLGNEFRFDLWGSVGVYSDFNKITSDCIYVRGLARGYYQYSNTCELMAGVMYLNRERIKLMPTFGIIWAPSAVLECHLVFPDPKILRHVYTTNDTQWWAYVRADYGGGSWAINTDYGVFRTDYNDIRVALGLEFRNKPGQCLSGYFEVGGAFNRELYADGQAWYKPSSCVFLAGGLKY